MGFWTKDGCSPKKKNHISRVTFIEMIQHRCFTNNLLTVAFKIKVLKEPVCTMCRLTKSKDKNTNTCPEGQHEKAWHKACCHRKKWDITNHTNGETGRIFTQSFPKVIHGFALSCIQTICSFIDEKFKSCLHSHLHTPGQLLCELGILVRLAVLGSSNDSTLERSRWEGVSDAIIESNKHFIYRGLKVLYTWSVVRVVLRTSLCTESTGKVLCMFTSPMSFSQSMW